MFSRSSRRFFRPQTNFATLEQFCGPADQVPPISRMDTMITLVIVYIRTQDKEHLESKKKRIGSTINTSLVIGLEILEGVASESTKVEDVTTTSKEPIKSTPFSAMEVSRREISMVGTTGTIPNQVAKVETEGVAPKIAAPQDALPLPPTLTPEMVTSHLPTPTTLIESTDS
ncbi:hypothetical protein HAX54_012113 [Datura stramonium]|uniref:Uncharacterized protein n=1 Tax=Datura stramonium TaxID=4076 RepID=A0ABS8RIJ2_DATST|nr:hypothetical protein [Datura stramonium]